MQRNQLRFVFTKRLGIIVGILLILLTIVILKFFFLQVIQHNYFQQKATNNSIKLIPIAPARGLILDRHNKVLAENKLVYNLELDPTI